MAYFEPKEYFMPADQRNDLSEALTRGTISIPTYLFGWVTDLSGRCQLLSGIITVLKNNFQLPPPPPSHMRPKLLDGHPLRPLSLYDVASLVASSNDRLERLSSPLMIPCLREYLTQSLSSNSNSAVLYGQRLGQALLHRFWNLRHADDLYEAIWLLYDALEASNSHAYSDGTLRTLEICLDLTTALFFRYQLLQLSSDRDNLCKVLAQQTAILRESELRWIWAQSGPEGSADIVLYRSRFLSRTMDFSNNQPSSAVNLVNRHEKYYIPGADFHVLVSGIAQRSNYRLKKILSR